jgi:peptide chain release factor 3
VVQVLRDPDLGDQAPVLAAVGPMQFEVAVHRLELHRADGTILALFESHFWVERLEREQPDLLLERLVAEGSAG